MTDHNSEVKHDINLWFFDHNFNGGKLWSLTFSFKIKCEY